jgi:LEA14-like dessication related protein
MRKFIVFFVIVFLLAGCKSQPPVEVAVIEPEIVIEPEPEPEPVVEVIEPVFEIVSIIILKADLVNTQFETLVKVTNPNEFALDLSAIHYELYGNGAFWASGKGVDLLHIPANDSCQTEFRFMMNFIDMNRKLLDDIIAMRNVKYRFSGNVEVEPAVPSVPSFNMSFERSGLSGVKDKADSQPGVISSKGTQRNTRSAQQLSF